MCSTLSKVFFSVSKGNDFNEDKIGTITSEFHEKELDTDRIRTVANELEEEEVLLCDICEFVLVESCSEDRLLPCYFYSLCLLTLSEECLSRFHLESRGVVTKVCYVSRFVVSFSVTFVNSLVRF